MKGLTIIFEPSKRFMIHRVEHAEDLDRLISGTGSLLVYFFNDHCAPCLSLRPKVEEMVAARFPSMELVYVNGEQFPELTSRFAAFSFPVLLFFFGGKEFLRYSKYVSMVELDGSVGRIYDLYYAE